MAIEVYMPKMSAHMESGEVVGWLVSEGAHVEKRQPILELTTDKVVAELEAPATGILKGIRPGVVAGAVVRVGETIAFIAQEDEQVPDLPPLSAARQQTAPSARAAVRPSEGAQDRAARGPVRAAPAARALAKKLGVDLTQVTGTGPEGRIREEDVQAFHAAGRGMEAERPTPSAPAFAPQPLAAQAPAREEALDVEWVELNPFQRALGQRMTASWQTIPQFSVTASVDMTNAFALREALARQAREPLSTTAILVWAVARVLQACPRLNASFEDGRVKQHRRVHVGVALGTEEGLVIPVLHNAERKTLTALSAELAQLQARARTRQLAPDDLMGATFTLLDLGMYAVERCVALVHPPQSAILAVGRITKMPAGLPDDTLALYPMLTLTLTADHRSLDGPQAAHFLTELKQRLEQPYLLLGGG